jgi:hypothetical protein
MTCAWLKLNLLRWERRTAVWNASITLVLIRYWQQIISQIGFYSAHFSIASRTGLLVQMFSGF